MSSRAYDDMYMNMYKSTEHEFDQLAMNPLKLQNTLDIKFGVSSFYNNYIKKS